MKREELQQDFHNYLGESWSNSQGKINIYYVMWLENKVLAIKNNYLPPAEGAEAKKTCVLCTKPAMDNGLCFEHNMCNVPKQPQPTAEGAEEMLKAVFNEIWDAPVPDDVFENPDYRMSFADAKIVAEKFATLHAQRLAEKMVEEKCKKCKYRGLPDSIQEALNSGDGVYRP